MARHWRIRYAGAKYHLTGRGNGREVVFATTHDYERFLAQLAAALAADEVVLYAYVLMPNTITSSWRPPWAMCSGSCSD
jgi:REP element-mobilizing transposase RayT